MKSAYDIINYVDDSLLQFRVGDYRKSFLKRKNINRWKRYKKGTPNDIAVILNSFDRKINGISILSDKVKTQYFKGLNKILCHYYDEKIHNKFGRSYAYISYRADEIIQELHTKNGRSRFISNKVMTYKEFKKAGLCKKYRTRGYE